MTKKVSGLQALGPWAILIPIFALAVGLIVGNVYDSRGAGALTFLALVTVLWLVFFASRRLRPGRQQDRKHINE